VWVCTVVWYVFDMYCVVCGVHVWCVSVLLGVCVLL